MPVPLARAEARPRAPAYPHFSQAVRSLLALGPADCRWPVAEGEGDDFTFCASPRLGHASYCGRHRGLACEAVR